MAIETNHADWRRTLPVVDAHAHFDPGRADDCIRYMDRVGIETMVDFSPNTGEDLRERLDVVQAYPCRFGTLAGVDFEGFGEDGWIERECARVERAIEAGALGIKFWKDLGTEHEDDEGNVIPVDDERLGSIVETVGDCGGIVAFHVADPKPFFEPLTPENERYEQLQRRPEWWFGDREQYPYGWWDLIRQLERVIERHPDVTILGAHFGCAAEEVGYVADVMRQHPNYVVDVSARVGMLGRHRPDLVHDVFVEFQDRILFATDVPVWESTDRTAAEIEAIYDAHWRFFETDDEEFDPPTGRPWTIDAIDLPREVLEKLYVENARRHLLR